MILTPCGPIPAGLPVPGPETPNTIGPGPYMPGSPVGWPPPAGCPLYLSPPNPLFDTSQTKQRAHVNGHIVRRGKPCYMLFRPTGTRELTPAGQYGASSSDAKFSWANRFALWQLMQQQRAQQEAQRLANAGVNAARNGFDRATEQAINAGGVSAATAAAAAPPASPPPTQFVPTNLKLTPRRQGQNVQGCYEIFGQLYCP